MDNKPLNVAFLIDKFDVGGTQRQLIMLANRLASLRLGRVIMLCLQRPGPLANELHADIEFTALGLKRIYGIGALRRLLQVRAQLRAAGCDVIHAFLPSANIFAALLRSILRIHVIASRRDIGIYPGKLWQKLEERFAFRRVDLVICVSQEVRNLLLHRQPGLARKTVVVTNAIDVDAADRLSATTSELPSGNYIVCIGNIKPVKAYDFLLDAAADIEGRVVVIGSGTDLERLREAVRSRRLDDRLEFLGHRDSRQIAAIARRAIFAVHPSFSEGVSNAILEYMAHGLPVVCRNIAGNVELIAAGETGLLFSDRSEFVAYVNQLLRDSVRRKRMGAAARRYVEQSHGLDSVMTHYLQTYRQLIDDRSEPTVAAEG